jgi:hypothetical protein
MDGSVAASERAGRLTSATIGVAILRQFAVADGVRRSDTLATASLAASRANVIVDSAPPKGSDVVAVLQR